jgi:hypothetical protein
MAPAVKRRLVTSAAVASLVQTHYLGDGYAAMSTAHVLWVLLPMFVGAVLLAVSAACAWKTFSAVQCIALLIVLVCVGWSEMVLFSIARGAWPTFLPHIVLALALVVASVQVAATLRMASGR